MRLTDLTDLTDNSVKLEGFWLAKLQKVYISMILLLKHQFLVLKIFSSIYHFISSPNIYLLDDFSKQNAVVCFWDPFSWIWCPACFWRLIVFKVINKDFRRVEDLTPPLLFSKIDYKGAKVNKRDDVVILVFFSLSFVDALLGFQFSLAPSVLDHLYFCCNKSLGFFVGVWLWPSYVLFWWNLRGRPWTTW